MIDNGNPCGYDEKNAMKEGEGMKQRGKLRWILMAICLVCLVVSGIWLGRYWLQSRRTMENVAELKKLVQEAEAQAPEEEGSGLLRLAEENSDLAGWIRVPGTAVDYVVSGKPAQTQASDERYYIGSRHAPAGRRTGILPAPELSAGV